MRAVFDAGHGGTDPGAIGQGGLHEADVVLEVAGLAAAMALADGWAIGMTRMRDVFVGLGRRCEISNEARADVFVSIHCNAAVDRTAHGLEVWTSPGQTRADRVSDSVLALFARSFPRVTQRKDLADGDGDREKHLAVLDGTDAPAILVELDFISCPEVEARMRTTEWRRACARSIVDGLNAWQGPR